MSSPKKKIQGNGQKQAVVCCRPGGGQLSRLLAFSLGLSSNSEQSNGVQRTRGSLPAVRLPGGRVRWTLCPADITKYWWSGRA